MPSEQQDQVREHRDFPRLPVDAKVRIAGTATEDGPDQPAELTDLSLGGARLSTPAPLEQGADIGLIPFSGLQEDHPLHRTLQYQVVWQGPDEDSKWREYGLAHMGSVLDVLNSWLGHLLLRQKQEPRLQDQRRENQQRLRFDKTDEQQVIVEVSHNQSRRVRLVLLDVAAGGLLARAESDELEVGVHVRLNLGHDPPLMGQPPTGCVMDKRNQFDSTFYRIAFDPDSQLDNEVLRLWAERVGGELSDL